MSVAKHQACFTTKLQGQNLATFSHSAVMPIAYLQHTVNTNKTCVIKINAVNNAIKKINCSTALVVISECVNCSFSIVLSWCTLAASRPWDL